MACLTLRSLGALALVGGIAAPATAQTPSALVASFTSSPAGALDAIAQGCRDEGQTVTGRNAGSVTCEQPLGPPERIAARFLLRAPFARSPRALIRFEAGPNAPVGTLVRITGWVEDAPAMATRRMANLAGARFDARLSDFVTRRGGRPSSH